jgi:hypothetical protein
MTKTRLLLGAFLGATLSLSASPLDALADDAWFVLSAHRLAETRAALQDHPLAEVFANEQLRKLLADDEAADGDERSSFKAALEDEFGLSLDEFFELFPGQAHLALYGLGETLGGPGERPELAVLAEFTGAADRLKELMDIQFERNAKAQREKNPAMEHHMLEESFMGETLYFDEAFDGEKTYIEDGYALVDGVFLLATPESRLRSLVEAVKEGTDRPLRRSGPYLRMTEGGGASDLSFYANFPAFVPALERSLRKAAAAPMAAGFGITPDSLVNALALHVLEGAFFDLRLTDDGVFMHTGLAWSDKRGLVSLMTYGDGELPRPAFVPDDPVSASATLFEFSTFYENLRALIAAASPSLGQMVDMQLQTAETNLGVALRAALLENFGREVSAYAQFDEPGPGGEAASEPRQIIAFSLRDPAAFQTALDGLLGQNPAFEAVVQREEFEGYSIVTVPGQPHPARPGERLDDVSYTVTRSQVFLSIGRVAVLKEGLGRLDRSGGGFWDRGEVEDWFAPVAGPDPVSRSYTDVGAMVGSVLNTLRQAWAGKAAAKEVDFDKLADSLELPFVLVTEMNEEADGLYSRALLRVRPEESGR